MNESIMGWLPIILLFVFMWVFLFLPQSRREKQRQAMLNALVAGDKVETVSRVFGIVDSVDKDEVIVCIGLNDHGSIESNSRKSIKIRIHRDGIARVIKDEDNKSKS